MVGCLWLAYRIPLNGYEVMKVVFRLTLAVRCRDSLGCFSLHVYAKLKSILMYSAIVISAQRIKNMRFMNAINYYEILDDFTYAGIWMLMVNMVLSVNNFEIRVNIKFKMEFYFFISHCNLTFECNKRAKLIKSLEHVGTIIS